MKNIIQQAIANIKNEVNYIENNDDYLDPFYDNLADNIVYSGCNIKNFIKDLIEEKTDFNINDQFINDFIENDLYFDEDYITLKRAKGYSLETNEMTSFNDEEQTIQIFSDLSDNQKLFTDEEIDYIERETDVTIVNDHNYCYSITHNRIAVIFNENYFISQLPDLINNWNYDQHEILIDSHHGIYIPKVTIEDLKLEKIQGIKDIDLKILKDPDNEFYLDTWNDFLSTAVIENYKGDLIDWRFEYNEGGDLCLFSDNYIYTDC